MSSAADVGPLEEHLENLLAQQPEGISEHTLIRRLATEGWPFFADAQLADQLQLYRVHFVLFHFLYRLRDHLRGEQRAELHISPLRIALGAYSEGRAGLAGADPLRAYYLDWDNLDIGRGELRAWLDRMDRHALQASGATNRSRTSGPPSRT